MTVMEFFGCAFMAFGPPMAMFLLTIVHDPIRIIIMIASAFFWLLALLLSSMIWFAIVPLQQYLAFAIVFSVGIQEVFRGLIYAILKRAENGLRKITLTDTGVETISLLDNRHILAYVCGLGFGIISGIFSLINVLADAIGPGTMGLKTGTEIFFITSAATVLAFILMHIFWSIIFFHGMDTGRRIQVAHVIVCHYLVSAITLYNRDELYIATILPIYLILCFIAVYAYRIAGGTFSTFKNCISTR